MIPLTDRFTHGPSRQQIVAPEAQSQVEFSLFELETSAAAIILQRYTQEKSQAMVALPTVASIVSE